MAFGDLLGTAMSATAASIGNSIATSTGSATVAVGDVVFCAVGQQTGLNAVGCSDNLGNVYTSTNVGLDSGTATGRAFYSVVTKPGGITAVTADTTGGGTNDGAIAACAFQGPFYSVIDSNPGLVEDVASGFDCPATGTLLDAIELVIAWATMGAGVTTWAATSPMTMRVNVATANIGVAIASKVTAVVTTTTPQFTNAVNPTDDVLGTNSFRALFLGAMGSM